MNIIGLSGRAGSGKDSTADILVRDFGFAKVALADPMKRIVKELWPTISFQELWGPSQLRAHHLPNSGVTIRDALQRLGTEWGRSCNEDVWVNATIGPAIALLRGTHDYSPERGLERRVRGAYQKLIRPYVGVVIPDIRFPNEVAAIRRVGGRVWRVVRPDVEKLAGAASTHASETSLSDDEPGLYDKIVLNNDNFEVLGARVAGLMGPDGVPYG